MSIIDSLKKLLDDGTQKRIATEDPGITGYRRIKGPAGSGKSLTLIARAVKLAIEGKQVIVFTYNVTLPNYLKYLVMEHTSQEAPPQIRFINFHKWCADVCRNTGNMDAYHERKEKYGNDEFFKDKLSQLVQEIYDDQETVYLPTYDAILVDEGQDFEVNWWQTLRKAVVEGGEMLLVVDKTQNVTEKSQNWTEERMQDCGFRGVWNELKTSFRLSNSMIPILQDFLETFPYDVGDEGPDIPERSQATQINLLDKFRWVQVPPGKSVVDVCIEEVNKLYEEPGIPTVYFLSGKQTGGAVVNEFYQKGVDVVHTYSKNDRKSREEKENFRIGCAEICATTLHSFKGWEASHLVVNIESIVLDRDRALFYTALSRLKKHVNGTVLTVVSSCQEQELEDFGRKHFPDFDPPTHNMDPLFPM